MGATTSGFGLVPRRDIVILAVPYAAILDVVKGYGEGLAGKLLVDIADPVAPISLLGSGRYGLLADLDNGHSSSIS